MANQDKRKILAGFAGFQNFDFVFKFLYKAKSEVLKSFSVVDRGNTLQLGFVKRKESTVGKYYSQVSRIFKLLINYRSFINQIDR